MTAHTTKAQAKRYAKRLGMIAADIEQTDNGYVVTGGHDATGTTMGTTRNEVFRALGRRLGWDESKLTKELIAQTFDIDASDQRKIRRYRRAAVKFFTL